jgi:hypothetical protein
MVGVSNRDAKIFNQAKWHRASSTMPASEGRAYNRRGRSESASTIALDHRARHQRYAKIRPGIVRHDTGAKPATPRRYGETDDKTEEVIRNRPARAHPVCLIRRCAGESCNRLGRYLL